MCTVIFAQDVHPEFPLIIAANRDEFKERETAPLHFWEDRPNLLAGRDLKEGGTWMGITKTGRFATITNYREVGKTIANAPSRGKLVTDFLNGEMSGEAYLKVLEKTGQQYNGFNLIFGELGQLYYFGNRSKKNGLIGQGVHGLSNSLLNTSWPKVNAGKIDLGAIVSNASFNTDAFLPLLSKTRPWPDETLPDTGVGLEKERWLSSIHIPGEHYGTRTSSVLLVSKAGTVEFFEKTIADGKAQSFSFQLEH